MCRAASGTNRFGMVECRIKVQAKWASKFNILFPVERLRSLGNKMFFLLPLRVLVSLSSSSVRARVFCEKMKREKVFVVRKTLWGRGERARSCSFVIPSWSSAPTLTLFPGRAGRVSILKKPSTLAGSARRFFRGRISTQTLLGQDPDLGKTSPQAGSGCRASPGQDLGEAVLGAGSQWATGGVGQVPTPARRKPK